ncbi:MAG: porin [bacterium]|nr:porin [bacterium]
MNRTRSIFAIAALAALVALAAPAMAGPQMTFGPEDQGTLQIDVKSQFQMTMKDTDSEGDDVDSIMNFNFRRNRLAFMGAWGEKLSVYAQTEYVEDVNLGLFGLADADQGSNFQMLDAVARIKLSDGFRMNVGKFKYNLSRENLEACEAPLSLDRSLFIRTPFTSTRDMGVAVWGNLAEGKVQYRLDAMEGRKALSTSAMPKSSFRYSARAHLSLWDSETEYGYKGSYLGAKKVFTLGAAVQTEPEVVYEDAVAKTGKLDYNAYTVDMFYERPIQETGAITLSAAYENIDFDDAYMGMNPDPGTCGLNGQKNGWYAKAGYMLQTQPLQFFARYESWKFALLNNVYNQKLDWFSVGANYFMMDNVLKLTVEYSGLSFDETGDIDGLVTNDTGTLITQLQLVF